MPPSLALQLCGVFVFYLLFRVDRQLSPHVSPALWIPVSWVLVVGSREPSKWFDMGTTVESYQDLERGSNLDAVFFATVICLSVLILMKRNVRWGGLASRNLTLIIFIAYCGMSVIWSDYPEVSLKRWFKLVGSVLVALVILTDPAPLDAARSVLRRSAYVLVPFSVLLIKYYGEMGKWYRTVDGSAHYVGVATHKNSLGAVCLLAGIVLLLDCLMREKTTPSGKDVTISQVAMVALTVWLFEKAHSATALVCFGLSALIIIASQTEVFKDNPRRIGHFVLWAGLCGVSLVVVIGVSAELVTSLGRDVTLTGRTSIWDMVLKENTDPILGTGYESFWLGPRIETFWEKYSFHLNQAHNGYLEVYINLGLIGLALFIGLLIAAFRNGNESLLRYYGKGVLWVVLLLVVVLSNITEAGVKATSLMWFVLLIILIAPPRGGVREGLINSRFRSEICFSDDPQVKFGEHPLIRGPVHGGRPPADGPWPASGPTFPTPLP